VRGDSWLVASILGWALLTGLGAAAPAQAPPAADPTGEVATAVRSLGAPGLLWGRVAFDEESPDGATTPLGGVDVRVYPATPGLAASLEEVRARARDSRGQYDTAVARVQAILAAHGTQAETAGPAGQGQVVRSAVTDRAGVFVFADLPSGPWLLVAVRVSPYARRAAPETRRRDSGRLLPRVAAPPKQAEVWVVEVQVSPGGRTAAFLTDRSRWLTGPVQDAEAPPRGSSASTGP
jgi:hypothetical protein